MMSNSSSASSYYGRSEGAPPQLDSILYPHPANAPANYTGVTVARRDISVRRLRPTMEQMDVGLVAQMADGWLPQWATDGEVLVSDDGTGQYSLVGARSHHVFYAGLVLAKWPRPAALKCTIIPPAVDLDVRRQRDALERNGHTLVLASSCGAVDGRLVTTLRNMLGPRGYKFAM